MIHKLLALLVVGSTVFASQVHAEPPSSSVPKPAPARFEFTRLVAHWAEYDDPDYLKFIEDAQPDVAQFGFYGGHFYSLAHTESGKGYPAHFPVQGLAKCGDWFQEKNVELHKRGAKVVGHFNVEFLVGDPDGPKGPTGFFKFYRDLWDEKELGKRPVDNPLDLLEKNADGTPISQSGYGIGGMKEYWACLRNPHWQTVLKAWLKRGLDRGVDGYIANYFYRHNCFCEHCQSGFRKHLKENFTAKELQEKFGFENADKHVFSELGYWHDPKKSSPLKLETLRWSQISNKQVFDEVFVKYGRSLKPDLIVGQWNHLGDFSQISGDERCMLPADLWGKDETYLWYSTGDAAHYTDLSKRFLGEGTLQARYIRGAFDDKPYTLGKYESTRTRASIAELAANGGAPMGFYTRFKDPAARKEIVRYYQFMKQYDDLYRGNRPHSEAVLLFPRKAVHQGDVAPITKFRDTGRTLLDSHILFDILPDDLATKERTAGYQQVIKNDSPELIPAERAKLSTFEAPYSVRVSASRPAKGDDLVIHFVNYNREEPPKSKDGVPSSGGGIVDEKPIAVKGVAANIVIPPGFQVTSVEAFSPEKPDPLVLETRIADGRVKFTMPEFLVYGVARIQLKPVR